MNITADERRNVLGLFNIAEAARRLGIPVRKMRWEIASGRLPSPTVALGKRRYFTADDLQLLERCVQRTGHSCSVVTSGP